MKTLPVNHEDDLDDPIRLGEMKSIRPKRRFRPFALIFRILCVILVLCVVGIGVLYLVLSRGAISNTHLKAQIESQLSTVLGPRLEVKSADAKFAFGKNGLIALDVSKLRVLRDKKTNLGVVDNVAVTVKAFPLLSGKVVAKSVYLNGAAIAIDPYLPTFQDERLPWPEFFDFSPVFQSVGKVMRELTAALDSAGLEKVSLSDAKLIGFDHLGLQASHARIVHLQLEREGGTAQQVVFELAMEVGERTWNASGVWQAGQNDGRVFSLVVDGITLESFPEIALEDDKRISLDNPLRVKLSAPFEVDGNPKQATLGIEVLEGGATLNQKSIAHLLGAELNFRYFPEKNQIELEPSPIRFESTSFLLLGGVKFPAVKPEEGTKSRPVFQIIANDLIPYGLIEGKAGPAAAAEVSGWIDAKNRTLRGTSLRMKTTDGDVKGTGALLFDNALPAFNAALKTEKISISTLKQFWPWFLAPDFRKWADKNLSGGTLTNSSFDLDFTPGLLGNRERYTEQTLSGDVNVSGATVKTVGALPLLKSAVAKVKVAGTRTSISLKSGKLDLGKNGTVRVTGGTMKIGSYAKPKISTSLQVAVAGDAKAIVQLGTLKPLSYSKALDLEPHQCSGEIKAIIQTNFGLTEVAKQGVDSWKANIDINKGALKNPLFGYKVDKVDVKIEASEGIAKIVGTANVDGLPAKLALVEKFGSSGTSKREISLMLDDAARKRLGADTGDVITGPVKVSVKALPGGLQKITADLRQAKLNLSWVGWSKGAGIPAKATFVLKRDGSISSISDLRVDGNGFSANGNLKLDKSGLRSASFSRVKLNKTDNFDVDVSRTKYGYSIKFGAKSYDGRALIQSFLQNGRKPSKKGPTISLDGQISQLIGFGNQSLRNVRLSLKQSGSQVQQVHVEGMAEGNAPTIFTLAPITRGSKIDISTSNAGSMLRFLDLYTKARGGTFKANLVRDNSQVYTGIVVAKKFTLLGEPRLAALLSQPQAPRDLRNRSEIVKALKKIKTDTANIDQLQSDIRMGNGSLKLFRGRLTGGDASAEFSGTVYNKYNKMKIRGTYLPARTLNRMVSKIPVLGWALGEGKVSGLLGITFKLSGPYRNPKLRVNPLSIITPGVFRKIFR